MDEFTCYGVCGRGLESALEGELRALGARNLRVGRGGVTFRANRRLIYAANLWLRSAIRVQEELIRREVATPRQLYEAVSWLPWEKWIHPDQTMAVYATTRDTPALKHSGYAALTVKDAVVDVLRKRTGRRPNVDSKNPDVAIRLVVKAGRSILYRDTSGESLHKRGWRPILVRSPLNEATAAGLLLLTGWDKKSALVDPMCGSGTFLVEAAMMAIDRAPGINRSFAFERGPDFDARLWRDLKEEARAREKPAIDFMIEGADHHGGALSLARRSLREADVEHLVTLAMSDARDFVPREPPRIVVVNPPYGERLGADDTLIDSWVSLGNFLHRQCGGSVAWVLSGNKMVTRHLGLRATNRIPVMNGGIDCRWIRYDVRG